MRKSKAEAGREGGSQRSVAKSKATRDNLQKARLAKLLKRLNPSLGQTNQLYFFNNKGTLEEDPHGH